MKKFPALGMIILAGLLAFGISSCSEEESPEPTVRFLTDIDPDDGYTVNLTVEVTDANSFEWDYGDGGSSTESVSHSYTYEESGPYTISVTVTGDGGSATDIQEVTIVVSLEEILAGSGDDGKTWVLTQSEGSFLGQIGAGAVDGDAVLTPEMSLIPNGFLNLFGLGDEYPDEYTFFKDGTYKIDVKNGQALAGLVYGEFTETMVGISTDPSTLPLCVVQYPNIEDGTWSLSYDDLTVTAYNELTTKAIEDVKYQFGEDALTANLVLSSGSFIGPVDLSYPAIPTLGLTEAVDNSYYVIKEMSPEAIHVVVGLNGVPFIDQDGNPVYEAAEGLTPVFMLPTLTLHLTFVPK